MANRYWVGGTGSWNDTNTTNWSATSGGAGGASVPTISDDVFFDAFSGAGIVTILLGNLGAKSINCTGFTGTWTLQSANLKVAGNVTLSSSMTFNTGSFSLIFVGTATLITAGKAMCHIVVGTTTSGEVGNLTLGDALNASNRDITVVQGTFNTANFGVTCNNLYANVTSPNYSKTISFGSSTVNIVALLSSNDPTNFTFNAGTSQLNLTGGTGGISNTTGASLTLYNVSYTSTGAGARRIIGACVFNNLTLAVGSGVPNVQLTVSANQTVNGTLTCAGFAGNTRGFVCSNDIGTPRTITAAAVSAADCDWRDITIAGAAAPIAPTRAGNCGGNSGITFPAAKTVYRVGTSTNWLITGGWATSSGGAGSDANFPLPQDTAVIDNGTTGTSLSINNGLNIGTLDCSGRTTAFTLTFTSSQTRYGSLILGSGITVAGTSSQTFSGRGTMTFTSAGKTITFSITVNAPGGTFQLGDAFNSTSPKFEHSQGTVNANNFNLTCLSFTTAFAKTRTITMGSGLWTLTGTSNVWNVTPVNDLTFNKGTANILLSNTTTTARGFTGGGLSYNKLTIGGATGTSIFSISGTNSFTELASTKTVAHTITFNDDQGTIDTWSIAGVNNANRVIVKTAFAGTRRAFSLTNRTQNIDFLDVQDIQVNQHNRFYVGTGSINRGNNRNVYFSKSGEHAGFLPLFL